MNLSKRVEKFLNHLLNLGWLVSSQHCNVNVHYFLRYLCKKRRNEHRTASNCRRRCSSFSRLFRLFAVFWMKISTQHSRDIKVQPRCAEAEQLWESGKVVKFFSNFFSNNFHAFSALYIIIRFMIVGKFSLSLSLWACRNVCQNFIKFSLSFISIPPSSPQSHQNPSHPLSN